MTSTKAAYQINTGDEISTMGMGTNSRQLVVAIRQQGSQMVITLKNTDGTYEFRTEHDAEFLVVTPEPTLVARLEELENSYDELDSEYDDISRTLRTMDSNTEEFVTKEDRLEELDERMCSLAGRMAELEAAS